jgi:hypothetical protein
LGLQQFCFLEVGDARRFPQPGSLLTMTMTQMLRRASITSLQSHGRAGISIDPRQPGVFTASSGRPIPRHERAARQMFRRRLKAFIVLALLLTALQSFFLFMKVLELPPPTYSRHAVDLQVTPGWRYGYARGWHGAVLVKAVNSAQAVPLTPFDSVEIADAMARELEMVPWKFFGELLFYIGLLAFVLFVPRRLAHGLSLSGRKRRIMPMYMGLWAAAWIVFLLPLLAGGYGASIFSTWEGPGALSCSGPYPMMTATPADTVSYRPLLEAGAMWPLIIGYGVLDLVSGSAHLPTGIGLLIFGTLVHGGWGLLMGANCFLDERNRMQ